MFIHALAKDIAARLFAPGVPRTLLQHSGGWRTGLVTATLGEAEPGDFETFSQIGPPDQGSRGALGTVIFQSSPDPIRGPVQRHLREFQSTMQHERHVFIRQPLLSKHPHPSKSVCGLLHMKQQGCMALQCHAVDGTVTQAAPCYAHAPAAFFLRLAKKLLLIAAWETRAARPW